ncbi:GNAT family N-acetyltransferase ['Paenibacillus yunnanensis' Narsing Rao et al. 2020]|uniref:GNAT family N-acetyltransferase n=1 Tax=Paenibacillus tengchongensis TaxID=2608684 RepID=UPI00124BF065|nr:GNAT family N-acetyltransferase [Paenibacillus tengchongensis]
MELTGFKARALQPGDLETVCTFAADAAEVFNISPKFHHPLTAEQMQRALENRFSPTVIVSEDGSGPLGYANLYDLDEASGSCWLGNVIVSPACRGTGAAPALIAAMKDTARREYGLRTLKLFYHCTNTRALLFYCKHGFQPCGYKYLINPDGQKIVSIEMQTSLEVSPAP